MSAIEKQVQDGYKSTEIGVIPKEWNVEKFGNVVQPSNSRINPAISGGGHLCIELEHISQNRGTILGSTKTTLNSSIKNNFKEQSVLFGKLRSYLRKYWFATKEGVCSTEIWVFNAIDNPKVTPKFLYQIVQLESFIELASEGYGTHMPRADWNIVKELTIALPSKQEQTAITNALSDVDALLTEMETLIAKKQAIKTATMQQLLTGKTRLPQFAMRKDGSRKGTKQSELGEIPEDWDLYSLDKLVTSTQLGGNYSNSEAESNFPLIKMGNLGRGKIKLDKLEYVNDTVSARDRLKSDDVLFNTRNTLELVGKVAIWKDELAEAYFNSNIMRFVFNDNLVSSNSFMNAAMNTKRFVTDLTGIATGTTSVAAIYTRDLLQLKLLIPPKEEQTAIATILSDMDTEIQTLEQRLVKTRQIKQGMMQELLTGRTRLPYDKE